MATETGWAIAGTFGLYVGWWQTRNSAIGEHVSLKTGVGVHYHGRKLSHEQVAEWKKCKRAGDRVVKVQIRYK